MKHLIYISLLLLSMPAFANVHLGPGQSYPNVQAAADAKAIKPGDTVFLHAGAYTGYQTVNALKGEPAKWIVFTRFENDNHEIAGNWHFRSCEYVKFVNLNFKANANQPGRLINVDNSGSCDTRSRFIKFDSCSFSDVTDPNIITAFKFAGVDNFEVSNCIFRNLPGCNAFDFNVCHDGLISGNRIENCMSGGHIKGGASNIIMERNLFLNASVLGWVAFELGGDTGEEFYCPGDTFEVKNLNFYSNIIVGGWRGLALASAVDCNVANNTFYNCGQAAIRFLTTSSLYPTLSGNRVENNIYAFGASEYINGSVQKAGAVTFANNIYSSILRATFPGPYWDTPALDAIKDPNPIIHGSGAKMFADGAGNDFHLIEGSVAIGKGTSENEPVYDFYGSKFAALRSIGAAEYSGGTGIFDESPVNDYLYPNPAYDYIDLPVNTDNCPEIKIYSALGIVVLEAFPSNRIDVSTLPAGIYFLELNKKIYKFVKV